MASSKASSKGSNGGGGAGSGHARLGISGPRFKKAPAIDVKTSPVGNAAAASTPLIEKEVDAVSAPQRSSLVSIAPGPPAKVTNAPGDKKKGTNPADKKSSAKNSRKNASSAIEEGIAAKQHPSLRVSRNAHPGLPDAPRPKRSSEVVAAERTDKALKVEKAKQHRDDALAKAAALEDQMAKADTALAASKGNTPVALPERQHKVRPAKPDPEGEGSWVSSEVDDSEDEEMLDVSEEEEKPKPKKVKKSKGDVRKAVAEKRQVVDQNKKRPSEEKRQ